MSLDTDPVAAAAAHYDGEPVASFHTDAFDNDDDPVEVADRLPVRHEADTLIPLREELAGTAAMAVTLARAQVVPAALRNQPHNVFAVLLTGRELGVAPMTAVRNFHVIDGQVTIPPKFKMGQVRKMGLGTVYPHSGPRRMPCPRLADPEHGGDCAACRGEGFVVKVCPCGSSEPDNDGERAVWHAERKDTPGIIFTSGYSIEEADSAGLISKSNWKMYPARMLSHRAAGYLLDDAFSEVATGLYTPDELGAVTDEDGNVIDVDSTESLIAPAKSTAPPAQPDVLAEFKRRIAKLTPEAKARLADEWKARPDLPKLDDLRYTQQTVVAALIAAAEKESKPALEPAADAAPPVTPEAPETPLEAAVTPDEPTQAVPPVPPPFDAEGLTDEDDDMAWAERAPDEWVSETIEEVTALDAKEMRSRAKALSLPLTGGEATIRVALTSRLIRRRMEHAL
jgi:hypothetical protein